MTVLFESSGFSLYSCKKIGQFGTEWEFIPRSNVREFKSHFSLKEMFVTILSVNM